MANITKIKLSGTSYNIKDSEAVTTSALTRAEYDALQVKDPNVFYIITDESGGGGTIDSSLDGNSPNAVANSAITSAINAKLNTSDFNTYSGSVDTALSNKQTTLTAGTNITIVDNVISASGGGGSSKELSAGTNISITTGETTDTISCTLPLSSGTGDNSARGGEYTSKASGQCSFAFGSFVKSDGSYSTSFGNDNIASNQSSFVCNSFNTSPNAFGFACGKYNSPTSTGDESSKTRFSIGNGYSNSLRHNAFEVKENGDIYVPNTDDTTSVNYYEKPMVRLQSTITQTAANTTALGGMSLVKLTQSEYDALATKNENTLYVIVN